MTKKSQAVKSSEEVLRSATPQKELKSQTVREKQLEAAERNAQADTQDTPDTRNWVDKQSLGIEETRQAREDEKAERDALNTRAESENNMHGNTKMFSSVEVEEVQVLGYNPVNLSDRLSVRDEKQTEEQVKKAQSVNESQKKAGVQVQNDQESFPATFKVRV